MPIAPAPESAPLSAIPQDAQPYDLLIIGGGINGAGVARDAAGRGLRVALLDKGDLAGATSSASSKLVHGGLRYLEFYEFALVRKALIEREVILRNAPHISRPLRFILPHEPHLRSALMIQAGLFLYDHLAKRVEVGGSSTIELQKVAAGPAFAKHLTKAFYYWDGWVDDARLVVLNAQDAAARGAAIFPREAAIQARRLQDGWCVTTSKGQTLYTKQLLNCAGPWADKVAHDLLGLEDAPHLSLVQGSHIIVPRISRTDEAWMLQQPDGRILFVIPYEQDFSLIGTTETPLQNPEDCAITPAEEAYMIEAVNRSVVKPIGAGDIVHRFSGVRPLVLEEGKGARETTRDWYLLPHAGANALTVIGGKITTYRVLAEAVLAEMFPKTKAWTETAPLPGGDIPRHSPSAHADFQNWLKNLQARHYLYAPEIVSRLARLYGTQAEPMLEQGLGAPIGGLFEAELTHLRDKEWARTADDVLWRRTKMGLRLEGGPQGEAYQQIQAFMGG